MANRSYPPFGKIKTIVLPEPLAPMTLKGYQEKYGIDLTGFVRLDEVNQSICFSAVNSMVLIKRFLVDNDILIPVVSIRTLSQYVSGSADAEMNLGWYNALEDQYEGLHFAIDKDASFSLDNVKVSFYEV